MKKALSIALLVLAILTSLASCGITDKFKSADEDKLFLVNLEYISYIESASPNSAESIYEALNDCYNNAKESDDVSSEDLLYYEFYYYNYKYALICDNVDDAELIDITLQVDSLSSKYDGDTIDDMKNLTKGMKAILDKYNLQNGVFVK